MSRSDITGGDGRFETEQPSASRNRLRGAVRIALKYGLPVAGLAGLAAAVYYAVRNFDPQPLFSNSLVSPDVTLAANVASETVTSQDIATV